MKKYILSLIAALSIFIAVPAQAISLPEKTDHEKVKVNLFWSTSCPHCHDFIKAFSKEYLKYVDYFEIVGYVTNNSEVNYNLFKEVSKNFEGLTGGVPLIIIGDDYYKEGFGSDPSEVIEHALMAYKDKDYVDLVSKTAQDANIATDGKSFIDTCNIAGEKCAKIGDNKGLSDGVVIGIIFGVLVLGFGGLVVYSKMSIKED